MTQIRDAATVGAEIAAATEAHAPYVDCSADLPDLAAAYAAQDAARAVLAPRLGGVGGRKIAYNAPGAWEKLGLADPAFGPVYAAWIQESPARLVSADLRAFYFEPEIAVVIGRDLPVAAEWTAETIEPYVARLHPAFELMDRRTEDGPPPLPSIANGVFNIGIAIGGPGLTPQEAEAEAAEAALLSRVTLDGEALLEAEDAAPMPPLEAAARIAAHFGARGEALRAGEILLCGAHLAPRLHKGPGALRFECGALGAVELALV